MFNSILSYFSFFIIVAKPVRYSNGSDTNDIQLYPLSILEQSRALLINIVSITLSFGSVIIQSRI